MYGGYDMSDYGMATPQPYMMAPSPYMMPPPQRQIIVAASPQPQQADRFTRRLILAMACCIVLVGAAILAVVFYRVSEAKRKRNNRRRIQPYRRGLDSGVEEADLKKEDDDVYEPDSVWSIFDSPQNKKGNANNEAVRDGKPQAAHNRRNG